MNDSWVIGDDAINMNSKVKCAIFCALLCPVSSSGITYNHYHFETLGNITATTHTLHSYVIHNLQ